MSNEDKNFAIRYFKSCGIAPIIKIKLTRFQLTAGFNIAQGIAILDKTC